MGNLLSNPLTELRDWRSRVWWAGLERVPAHKRVIGVSLHRRKGPVRLWEDVMVEACGIHWRSKRAACSTKRDWDLLSNAAITQLTFKYKLPRPPAVAAAAKLLQPKVPDAGTPTLAVSQLDLGVGAGLTIVVDCRPLARVLNGTEKLKNGGLEPLCSRATDKLVCLQHFWNQFHTKPSWISWRPRHLNQLADQAANQCMDNNLDFVDWVDPLPDQSILSDLHVMGFSDGGLRKESGRAAIGWIVVALVDKQCWLLGKGGSGVDIGEAGSFLIEAVALETLLDIITSLCMKTGVRDCSWQRTPVDFSIESEPTVTRI